MTFGFSRSGFPCKSCGKLINVLTQAVPFLAYPVQIKCPFCNHVDTYDEDSVRNTWNYKDS